ncbi:MAG: hypothetical protein ACLPND_19095 [Candidatus Korobacteraceae bacterium]
MKPFKYCRHVKEDGVPCGSPPLRGENYCHFHLRYKGYPAAPLEPAPPRRIALYPRHGLQPEGRTGRPETGGEVAVVLNLF